MRHCVTCVYWTLLLVSVIFSGVFFLIVASEATEASVITKDEIHQQRNNPVDDVGDDTDGADFTAPEPKLSEVYPRPTVKTEQQHLHSEENDGTPPSQENTWEESKTENNVDILKESLTQQPNLSQGISETGQAVVLTLVDTATAELQSLAEPRLTAEIRSRTSSKNATLTTTTTTTTIPPSTTSTPTTITAATGSDDDSPNNRHPEEFNSNDLPIVPIIVESSKNLTDAETTTEKDTTTTTTTSVVDGIIDDNGQQEEAVTVTIDGKIVEDSSTTTRGDDVNPDEVGEDVIKQEENLGSSPELDDGAARARLVGGSGDEAAAAVIIDGLVTSGSTDHHHEDIPSFSEWAQKRLEEAEKKKTHPNASIQNPGGPGRGVGGMRVRSKNYASPDCGAKIVAVNPEARSARSVLVSTRDEYMLNTCTSRVWFVVELCEAIQAKKIELANFELFSSSPKQISVYVSDRFPTRDWSPVGQFTAKDQRDIQSFPLHPHLFGKFIKLEMHSHYGSEHFCPISLFRAYGTSEFEVLETETDHQETETDDDNDDEDDEDEPLDSESSSADSRNLFGSARDAVLRIVKKAAEVLVKTSDPTNKNNITKIQESIEDNMIEGSYANCMTPRYVINCADCTDNLFASVFELLNCRANHLDSLLKIPFVDETLRFGEICEFHGVNLEQLSQGSNVNVVNHETSSYSEESSRRTKFPLVKSLRSSFLSSIFSPEYIVALCNVIATKERKLGLNTSYDVVGTASVNSSTRIDVTGGKIAEPENNGQPRVVAANCEVDSDVGACRSSASTRESKVTRILVSSNRESEATMANTPETTVTSSESLASQIKPTKTLSREDMRKESSVPILEPSKDPNDESIQMEVLTTPSPILNVPTVTTRVDEESSAPVFNSAESTTQTATPVANVPTFSSREGQESTTRHHEPSHEGGTTRQEIGEQDARHGKQEGAEQEAKLTAQEQISLDSILSDLKDLEGDANGIHGTAGQNSNFAAQPTASNTPQQKESVFLRLSNRIKALERNMSLSGQYLEELSKRYKKQVEEMQRSLERATATMTEESRKGEDREQRRVEEITALRDEINSLTQSMEILLHDRNSWRSKFSTICQHIVLIVVEIVVVIVVVSYCRRNSEFEDVDETRVAIRDDPMRRRSAGAMTNVSSTKKIRRRRPSEIASKIGGTYGDLMIDDRGLNESKRDKKKRKKRESIGRTSTNGDKDGARMDEEGMPGGTSLSSRRSSSIDPTSNHAKQLELSRRRKRPDSAPEYSGGWFGQLMDEVSSCDKIVEADDKSMGKKSKDDGSFKVEDTTQIIGTEVDGSHSKGEVKGVSGTLFRSGGILKAAKLSSPSFMKTALGSRNKRNSKTSSGKGDQGAQLKSDNWEWYSKNTGNKSDGEGADSSRANVDSDGTNGARTTNGHQRNPSDESGSSSATNTPGVKKEKKSGGGIRKMVRKLF